MSFSEMRKSILFIAIFLAGQEIMPFVLMIGKELFTVDMTYEGVCCRAAIALFTVASGTSVLKAAANGRRNLYFNWFQLVLIIFAVNAVFSIPWIRYDIYGAEIVFIKEAFRTQL